MPTPKTNWKTFELLFSMANPRTDSDQLGQAIHRLAGGPHHAAKDQEAEKRIVKSPGVMPKDADEDAALAVSARPEERPLCTIFDAAGQQFNALVIPDQVPVTLVDKVQLAQALRQRMRMELELEGAVPEPRETAAPRQANPKQGSVLEIGYKH